MNSTNLMGKVALNVHDRAVETLRWNYGTQNNIVKIK